jgi:hypothetical protein
MEMANFLMESLSNDGYGVLPAGTATRKYSATGEPLI